MLRKIKELKIKRQKAMEHPGALKIKSDRLKLKKVTASKQPIALKNKTEYKKGCSWIKKILDFKQQNKLVYFTGKQAAEIFKKHPRLDSPDVIKSILIASVNPNLDIKKIDSMVKSLYNKKHTINDRRDVIITMIRSIKIENYEYLL